eukprot:scaffold260199_cov21-Tisochrysis_lutea.AAC.1
MALRALAIFSCSSGCSSMRTLTRPRAAERDTPTRSALQRHAPSASKQSTAPRISLSLSRSPAIA